MRKLSPKAQAAGVTIERHVYGHAYAKSGNAHNPTERVCWIVRGADGRHVGTVYSYAGALELADMWADDPT